MSNGHWQVILCFGKQEGEEEMMFISCIKAYIEAYEIKLESEVYCEEVIWGTNIERTIYIKKKTYNGDV